MRNGGDRNGEKKCGRGSEFTFPGFLNSIDIIVYGAGPMDSAS